MLDFSWMDELIATQTQGQATEGHISEQKIHANNSPTQQDNRSEGKTKATEGKQYGKLEREKREQEKERERMREVYSFHQQNIKKSERIRCEINKGLKEGEAIESLFLKALEVISCMTGDVVVYEQNRAIIERRVNHRG